MVFLGSTHEPPPRTRWALIGLRSLVVALPLLEPLLLEPERGVSNNQGALKIGPKYSRALITRTSTKRTLPQLIKNSQVYRSLRAARPVSVACLCSGAVGTTVLSMAQALRLLATPAKVVSARFVAEAPTPKMDKLEMQPRNFRFLNLFWEPDFSVVTAHGLCCESKTAIQGLQEVDYGYEACFQHSTMFLRYTTTTGESAFTTIYSAFQHASRPADCHKYLTVSTIAGLFCRCPYSKSPDCLGSTLGPEISGNSHFES